MTKVELLMSFIKNTEVKWFQPKGIAGHYGIIWTPSKYTKVCSFFTSKSETTFGGFVYSNYRYSGANSYVNPPLLIPSENFNKFDKLIKYRDIDFVDFSKIHPCDNIYQAKCFAIKAIFMMMSSEKASNHYLLSMIIGNNGSFIDSIAVCEHYKNTKAEFFAESKDYFDDELFYKNMLYISSFNSEEFESAFDNLYSNNNFEHLLTACRLDMTKETWGESEKQEYNDVISLLENIFK